MAPNSNFDYAISWDNKALEPGTYRLEMKATDGDRNGSGPRNLRLKEKKHRS